MVKIGKSLILDHEHPFLYLEMLKNSILVIYCQYKVGICQTLPWSFILPQP